MRTFTISPQLFNLHAAHLGIPLYWPSNSAAATSIDVAMGEITSWGVPTDAFVRDGKPTALFEQACTLIQRSIGGQRGILLHPETREVAKADLEARHVDLRFTHLDAEHFSEQERLMADQILRAGWHVRRLYLLQRDPQNLEYERTIYGLGDPLLLELFFSNHGPWTEQVQTGASVLLKIPPRSPGSHLYPEGMNPDAFKALAEGPDGKSLTSPFVAVASDGEGYRAVPFAKHPLFAEEAQAVARHLREAANYALPPEEASQAERQAWQLFQDYLIAAADAFVSESPTPWEAADRIWVEIPLDFKWALRIAADETYWDEGAGTRAHAGYNIFFGLADANAQRMLQAFRQFGFQRMEDELVQLLHSKAYTGRQIREDVPVKFVRTIFVDGFARLTHGTVGGFSLPNWGPVAMGKQWVMSNMQDPARRAKFYQAYLGEESLPLAVDGANLSNTVTHEIFHGLGPNDDTQVRDEAGVPQLLPDGSPLTVRQSLTPAVQQVLEEAKASFVYLWFDQEMQKAGLIDEQTRREHNAAGIIWAFGHLTRGLFNDSGAIKPYSAVGAMMVGSLMEEGVLRFDEDRNVWDIEYERLPGVAGEMLRRIVLIQATGNREEGQKLIDHYTKDADLLALIRYEEIRRRAKEADIKPASGRYQVLID